MEALGTTRTGSGRLFVARSEIVSADFANEVRVAGAAVRLERTFIFAVSLGATVSARKVTAEIRPISVAGVRRPIVLLIAVRGFRFCICYPPPYLDGGAIASIIRI